MEEPPTPEEHKTLEQLAQKLKANENYAESLKKYEELLDLKLKKYGN